VISTGGLSAIDPSSGSNRIDFGSRPRILTIAFALLWLSGWLLLFTIMVLDYKRFGTVSVLEIAVLAVGGPPVALALLWVASGKRESLASRSKSRRRSPGPKTPMFRSGVR
jgi:hypothetical protein